MASNPVAEDQRPVVVWFRRDLRTDDHAPLYHATRSGRPIVPLFIIDTDIVRQLPSDGAVFNFQAEALRDLDEGLRTLGGRLIIRTGTARDVHQRIIDELRPTAIHYSRDYEPAARNRDAVTGELYRERGIEVHTHADTLLLEPEDVLTGAGIPYAVFTPYANAWKKLPKPAPFGAAQPFTTPEIPSDPIPGAAELRKPVHIAAPAVTGGERTARRQWNAYLRNALREYADARDIPAWDRTSHLSPHLRFGTISIRRIFEDCAGAYRSAPSPSIVKFIDELIWREFYQAVLFHHPHLTEHAYRPLYDAFPWKFDEAQFAEWKEGRTGYPLVDAGMRQLNTTGYMHNRVRMVTASFLTKHLRHQWKLGEQYFAEKLLDIETASNNGGWQWSASVGVDPKPLRIFNPRLQSERYDAQGEYIRRYVPELRAVPQKFIHAPHEMPPVLQSSVGCVIGKNYPAPIVVHADATREFKDLFSAVKSGMRN